MSDLTRDEVDHVARLARLALSDEERARYQKQLGAILGYVAKLRELDTAAMPPSAAILPLDDVMEDDEPRPSLTIEEVLANAPRSEDGFFRVPAVLEEP